MVGKLALIVLIGAAPTFAQSTKECRENAANWSAETDSQVNTLKYGAVLSRLAEVDACTALDKDDQILYLRLQVRYARNVAMRELDYIHRHGEMDSFSNEDVAGKR